jgi:hypothetical protein
MSEKAAWGLKGKAVRASETTHTSSRGFLSSTVLVALVAITLAVTFHGVETYPDAGCDATLSHTAAVALATGTIAAMVIMYLMCFVSESRPIRARGQQPLVVVGGLVAAGLLYMAALPSATGIELLHNVTGLSRSVLLIPTVFAVVAYGLFLILKSRNRGRLQYALGVPVALLAGWNAPGFVDS